MQWPGRKYTPGFFCPFNPEALRPALRHDFFQKHTEIGRLDVGQNQP
jgi:hypothetical protein